jgi:hypothetical protein
MPKYYDWNKTFSYQTGTNGEICLVLGAKDIGKTFGLRLACVSRFIKKHERFCEICRTNEEMKAVAPGYFDKLQSAGFFSEYLFKVERNCGYIAKRPAADEKPEYELICYFVALTNFQREKKRTYVQPKRFVFDEAIIDTLDRHHRYLKDEFLILAQLLDSVSRQQPGDDYNYYVYLLGNAVDLTAPYFQMLGIHSIPEFGYHYYKKKTVLLHYVEPWDADDRKAYTLVGRMLQGNEESATIFDNEFRDTTGGEIAKKDPEAKYAFAVKWGKVTFAIWINQKQALWYVTAKLPKGAPNVYTLAKRDSSVNYQMISKTSGLLKVLPEIYRLGGLRYETPALREAFFEVLSFIGIR